jgi:hypothetical protein
MVEFSVESQISYNINVDNLVFNYHLWNKGKLTQP